MGSPGVCRNTNGCRGQRISGRPRTISTGSGTFSGSKSQSTESEPVDVNAAVIGRHDEVAVGDHGHVELIERER